MGPATFVNRSRVLVVTGKGGTGKTTVSAVLANLAFRQGMRAMVVQFGAPEAKVSSGRPAPEETQLARLFGSEETIGYEPTCLAQAADGGDVSARVVRPDEALVEYLHVHGMRRLSRRLLATGALDVVATAVPGMPEMLVLGKLKQMERAAATGQPGAADLVILDAPAAGHAVRFLQSPHGLLDAAAAGPVRSQAEEVVAMLADASRCQVVLVTTPEETPVNETVETAYLLEERAGVQLAPVVVNCRLPVLALPALLQGGPLVAGAEIAGVAGRAGVVLAEAELAAIADAGRLRAERQQAQAEQVARLSQALPLPQLQLPFCFGAELGWAELEALTDALTEAVAGLPGEAP